MITIVSAVFQGTEEHPEDWLYGTNLETNRTGYVPAEYVTYIRHANPSPPLSQTALDPVKEEIDALLVINYFILAHYFFLWWPELQLQKKCMFYYNYGHVMANCKVLL